MENTDAKIKICKNYLIKIIELLSRFGKVEFVHLSREENEQVDNLAQSASGYREPKKGQVKIDKKLLPLVYTREWMIIIPVEVQDQWRKHLVEFLNDPSKHVSYHLWKTALGYCLLNEQL